MGSVSCTLLMWVLLVAWVRLGLDRVKDRALSAIYIDSGCTRDMLGGSHSGEASNISSETVVVDTAGGTREVSCVGDREHAPGLSTSRGLIAPWLPL